MVTPLKILLVCSTVWCCDLYHRRGRLRCDRQAGHQYAGCDGGWSETVNSRPATNFSCWACNCRGGGTLSIRALGPITDFHVGSSRSQDSRACGTSHRPRPYSDRSTVFCSPFPRRRLRVCADTDLSDSSGKVAISSLPAGDPTSTLGFGQPATFGGPVPTPLDTQLYQLTEGHSGCAAKS